MIFLIELGECNWWLIDGKMCEVFFFSMLCSIECEILLLLVLIFDYDFRLVNY